MDKYLAIVKSLSRALMFGVSLLLSFNCRALVAKGEKVIFLWKEPASLNSAFISEMQKMFIETFIAQYHLSNSFTDLTDNNLENILQEYFEKSIKPRFVNKEDQYFLCAQTQDKIIGFVFWEKLENQQAYVAELAIAKAYWRQGLGKIFMLSIFDKLPDTKKIVLLTEHENKGAQRFYESLGYKPFLITYQNLLIVVDIT